MDLQCWVFIDAFYVSVKVIMWFLSFIQLIYITLLNFCMLNQFCISGWSPTWPWYKPFLLDFEGINPFHSPSTCLDILPLVPKLVPSHLPSIWTSKQLRAWPQSLFISSSTLTFRVISFCFIAIYYPYMPVTPNIIISSSYLSPELQTHVQLLFNSFTLLLLNRRLRPKSQTRLLTSIPYWPLSHSSLSH